MSERVHPQQAQAAETGLRSVGAPDAVARLAEALLPPALPVLPRVQVAARYLPVDDQRAAGGDWFDAVPLTDGTVALAVGDVAGDGLAALAAMSQLRAVLAELLAAEFQLGTVLARADAFAARTPGLRSATLALVVLDPADGTLRYTTCGHPPPLIVGAGGTARYLTGTGTGPLGTGSPPTLATGSLLPGELVLLYTDGLIQRPHRSVAESIAELAAAVASVASQPPPPGASPAPADRVCQLAADQLAHAGYDDDIITLAAQRLAHPIPALDLRLPAELASLTTVRHTLGQWLDQIDPAVQERDDLQLAVGEIVTNVIEHAYPPGQPGLIELRAALADDGNLQCQVIDYGRWRPPDPAALDRGHGLMVATEVVDHLLVGHPGQASGAAPGFPGTMVTLRQRLHRPAMSGPPISTDATVPPPPPPPSFAVGIGIDGGRCLARVSGPVDVSSAIPLARRLLTASRGGTIPLTVDLTGVTRLGSAGTRALYQVRGQLAGHRQQFTLVAAAGSSVALILDLAQLQYVATAQPGITDA
jgi:serine phosphatase RsbU (regulator of sigma subunit)/anti-sigma regulatory factor (Ser/Thr protein kinase)/anti-anti-sigma regulatory factor